MRFTASRFNPRSDPFTRHGRTWVDARETHWHSPPIQPAPVTRTAKLMGTSKREQDEGYAHHHPGARIHLYGEGRIREGEMVATGGFEPPTPTL